MRSPLRKNGVAATAAVLFAILGAGCGAETGSPQHNAILQRPPPAPPPLPTPESLHANELGDVPVLMYHRITAKPRSVYDRTPEDFRTELDRLAAEDYVPVTTTEYATGRFDIPAGKHPVVLTFDDGTVSQFTLDGAGEPAPGTAIRILLDAAAAHPGFRPVATCYVNDPPFEEPTGRRSLNWLHEHGFEIGNHTLDHANLGRASDAEVAHQIAGMQRVITDAVPGVPVQSIALPLGVHPDNEPLAAAGSADGIGYHYSSVLLVGSNPAPSPWSAEFDPFNVPRIRSQGPTGPDAQYGSTRWLDKLAADPARRYTSDGDPNRVSAPADRNTEPAPSVGARLHRY
ncbi:polysaccharide deacetylase family protein [Saccharopolyspora phatthalungensis]|uniref:Peptidoglycan/xylan/chitin deacetylase (PgdA/CDA1 family) n=1 Tax=Saccharopolyspora phatthalungensis TaxID=664693 RepID=A0A840PWM6_9PSEU|nr:polysaccharide deacetylase family protein [Saccharopolyspora phatthalungensis]MBB5152726.1 peptidoglycan/xylan/chitin deacetylase (PgdA/CDA1 family) [Saccharopolyspora phatthalungensis]